jgi:predicted CXXCH cytochrome family protein
MLLKKQDALCLECHDGLQKTLKLGKSRHSPVDSGECTKCHNPHQSKLVKLLLAESPELCFTCHKTIKMRQEKEKSHRPAQRDCGKCHGPHASSNRFLLDQPLQALCGECHDLKGAPFTKAHLGISPTAMSCTSCHDPHTSKDPKFFKENVHPPFAARSCDECHITGDKP